MLLLIVKFMIAHFEIWKLYFGVSHSQSEEDLSSSNISKMFLADFPDSC